MRVSASRSQVGTAELLDPTGSEEGRVTPVAQARGMVGQSTETRSGSWSSASQPIHQHSALGIRIKKLT